jgi:hypothetical protein
MSSLRIALIACDNGLGHVRRMLSLSLALRDRGASPVLIAPGGAVQRLGMTYGVPLPEVIDFESRTTRADWLAPDANCWTDEMPALDDFDEVVSDNLVEILALRPRAWLSGSFFWHLALPNFPPHKAARAEELLARHRPRMIATGLFAAPYLAAKTRLDIVGMYALGQVVRSNRSGDLLISCGKGGEAETATRALLQKIACGARPGLSKVWVEPALHCYDMPDWMQPASFTPAMYGRLAAAVIRPGVGTVTDALLAGARLFLFHEAGNLEMVLNARRIAETGLGEAFVRTDDAWWAAVEFAQHRGAQIYHANSLQALDSDGADQAARILLMASSGRG